MKKKQNPTDDEIRAEYAKCGKVKTTAHKFGISVYAVEKACEVGDYQKRRDGRNRKKFFGSAIKISEQALLETEDEEIRGRKLLSRCLAKIAEKEYVSDLDLRKECKVESDAIWHRLQSENKKTIIIVGHNIKPKVYWGRQNSCQNLINKGYAVYLFEE